MNEYHYNNTNIIKVYFDVNSSSIMILTIFMIKIFIIWLWIVEIFVWFFNIILNSDKISSK